MSLLSLLRFLRDSRSADRSADQHRTLEIGMLIHTKFSFISSVEGAQRSLSLKLLLYYGPEVLVNDDLDVHCITGKQF